MNRLDVEVSAHLQKIFVICDQNATAPIWGFILRQQGWMTVLGTSREGSIDHLSRELPDLLVIDIHASHAERIELCIAIRAISIAPILLVLPAHHEQEILDAYAAGVDEVVIQPISPAVFLAKINAWIRRHWNVAVDGWSRVRVSKHRLDPTRRCLVNPAGLEIKLTNLEFRLMHLLMSQPGHAFPVGEIVQSIWGRYENGGQVLLKNVVYRLRRKIELDPGNPVLLQTTPGGYCFHE